MDSEGRLLAEAGRYARRNQAEEAALVVLALGLPYWIIETEGHYQLMVDARDFALVSEELKKFENEGRLLREQKNPEIDSSSTPSVPTPKVSLFVYGWILSLFFLIQAHLSSSSALWMERGAADSRAILHGQWWRVLTALTLHADLGHLIANIAAGAIFAGALLRLVGTGWTWTGIVLSGAAGNWLNAWGHRGANELHVSIGASTGVFGGLGMLVGWQILAGIGGHAHEGPLKLARYVLFPVAAGLALLAFLGTGAETERVDTMAHLFGMLSGVAFGVILAWLQLPQRTPPLLQKTLAAVALLLPCLGWWMALTR